MNKFLIALIACLGVVGCTTPSTKVVQAPQTEGATRFPAEQPNRCFMFISSFLSIGISRGLDYQSSKTIEQYDIMFNSPKSAFQSALMGLRELQDKGICPKDAGNEICVIKPSSVMNRFYLYFSDGTASDRQFSTSDDLNGLKEIAATLVKHGLCKEIKTYQNPAL